MNIFMSFPILFNIHLGGPKPLFLEGRFCVFSAIFFRGQTSQPHRPKKLVDSSALKVSNSINASQGRLGSRERPGETGKFPVW